MNSRSKYKTKQREILIRYLESVPGVHITAVSWKAWSMKGSSTNMLLTETARPVLNTSGQNAMQKRRPVFTVNVKNAEN